MARTVFTKGLVFDGTGSAPEPGEVVVAGDRVVETRRGWQDDHGDDRIVDATGCTVMPGLIEAHSHLTFPSAVGHIEPGFNPPVDVSFFGRVEGLDAEVARTERNAAILLDSGFTSAYSAGSILPMPTEAIVRDKIAAGAVPGPRLRAASVERDNHPVRPDGHVEADWQGPDACRRWVRDQAAMGFDSVKFLLSNDDVFVEGGSHMTQYTQQEASAAGEEARERGLWLNAHCQSSESVKIAVRAGFRSIYHCTYADEEALDLLESVKDDVFVSPAPGIIYANVHEGEEFGIDRAMAQQMGSVDALDAMAKVYPEIRRRGIRVLPGGDYGFPNNPIGRNARDLQLFVELLGYTELETLVAATRYGGQLMGMGDELGLLAPGYLADVLVVRGNPAEDISVLQDTANLVAIMQGGRFHKEPANAGAEG
ncbi:amidohydrolase family protein [Streptomyces sp. B21-108]|uniref:amidohydrolase family protein n=1 Tax=Streptomyces sp. B21-108 TaxID=3039419 RepID=UPI002FEFE8FD